MGHHDAHIVKEVAHLYKGLQLFGAGEKAKELSDVVKQHALLGIAAAMIPIGGLDMVALAANTWTMYARINKTVGVDFGENAMKSIASGVIANIVTLLPAAALGLAAEGILKYLPGIGTAGGIAIGAIVNVGIMYAAGKVYLKALQKLINNGEALTEDNISEAARKMAKEKSFVKDAYKEGKEIGKQHQKNK